MFTPGTPADDIEQKIKAVTGPMVEMSAVIDSLFDKNSVKVINQQVKSLSVKDLFKQYAFCICNTVLDRDYEQERSQDLICGVKKLVKG